MSTTTRRFFEARGRQQRHSTSSQLVPHSDRGCLEGGSSGAPSEMGNIESFPWEGLYQTVEEPATGPGWAADNTDAELNLFLTGLMYGE